jgi:hypothetical protein
MKWVAQLKNVKRDSWEICVRSSSIHYKHSIVNIVYHILKLFPYHIPVTAVKMCAMVMDTLLIWRQKSCGSRCCWREGFSLSVWIVNASHASLENGARLFGANAIYMLRIHRWQYKFYVIFTYSIYLSAIFLVASPPWHLAPKISASSALEFQFFKCWGPWFPRHEDKMLPISPFVLEFLQKWGILKVFSVKNALCFAPKI